MANAREIKSRISSVQDTMKITNAMYHYLRYVNAHADFMVSLSRLLFRSLGL